MTPIEQTIAIALILTLGTSLIVALPFLARVPVKTNKWDR
jgi:hypothetical protein